MSVSAENALHLQRMTERLSDVLHESCFNQCRTSDDTCSTREAAAELAEVLLLAVDDPQAYTDWFRKWYRPSQPLPKAVARRGWRRIFHVAR